MVTDEDVINELIRIIENQHYVNVGKVVESYASYKTLSQEDREFIKRKLMSRLCSTGKYMKDIYGSDLVVVNNPNYELSQITKNTSLIQRWVLFITIGLTIITIFIQWQNYGLTKSNQSKLDVSKEQEQNLQKLKKQVDSIAFHLSKTDSSCGR